MNHLAAIAIMSLASIGMWTAMGEGMILEWFRKLVEGDKGFASAAKNGVPIWAQKMLATCPRCMVTLFGTFILAVIGAMPEQVSEAFAYMAHTPIASWQFSCYANAFDLVGYIVCAVGLQEMLHR